MESEIEQKYIQAGKIASEAREYGKNLIIVGASFLEVSDKIEAKIYELGGVPAFPAQISFNNTAAHNCAEPNDKTLFQKGDICKLDIGVHIEGYVADTACTIDLSGENQSLVDASKNALESALKLVKPGAKLSDIGKVIHEEITKLGFAPIKNLSGHGVGKFIIHGPPQVPNYDTKEDRVLEDGMVIAIEPFASKGVGMIHETDHSNIFMVVNKKPVRSMITREVLKQILTYQGLPFTTRWLTKNFPEFKVRFALKDLLTLGVIKDFPPLPDKGLVSQAEHTVIVKDVPIITTL